MKQPNCTCPDTACALHPTNHNHGCGPCIQKNLKQKEMPSCFFCIFQDDVSDVQDYTIDGFVRFYQKLHPDNK